MLQEQARETTQVRARITYPVGTDNLAYLNDAHHSSPSASESDTNATPSGEEERTTCGAGPSRLTRSQAKLAATSRKVSIVRPHSNYNVLTFL